MIKPWKKEYRSEEELQEEFCQRTECSVCFPCDIKHEINNIECFELDEFLGNYLCLIKE